MFKLALPAVAAFALIAPAAHAADLTPITASVLAAPEPATATDGQRHLVYELQLANPEPVPIEVQSLAVRAGKGGTLATYDAEQVPMASRTLAPKATATVWLDLALERGAALPGALEHRFTVGVEGRSYTFTVGRTRVESRRPMTVDPPLRGGLWLNFNGCCGTSPHRTAIAPVDGVPFLSERFAADFIRVDANGNAADSEDITRNESFIGYGEPVFAVADGRVVSVVNDVAENTPLSEPPGSQFTLRTIVGNRIVLELGDGTYATYGHLKTGSVNVRLGQRVRRGQRLARVGNTGVSGAPHLHFQLTDGPDPIASDGRPYAFGSFRLDGHGDQHRAVPDGRGAGEHRRRLLPQPPRPDAAARERARLRLEEERQQTGCRECHHRAASDGDRVRPPRLSFSRGETGALRLPVTRTELQPSAGAGVSPIWMSRLADRRGRRRGR